EEGNPFPDYPKQTATDFLKVQSTYAVAKPIFGPLSATQPYAPPLPTTSPTGTFPVTLQGNIDEGLLGKGKVSLYRVDLADPFQRGVLVGSSPLTAINSVPDFGFDAPDVSNSANPNHNNGFWYSPPNGSPPDGSPWTFTQPTPIDGAGLVANSSAFNNPN